MYLYVMYNSVVINSYGLLGYSCILGIWIDRPCVVITTYVEILDGSWIYCYTGFILGRAPQTKKTLPDFFMKIWTPINGTQQCGIRLPEIHRNSAG